MVGLDRCELRSDLWMKEVDGSIRSFIAVEMSNQREAGSNRIWHWQVVIDSVMDGRKTCVKLTWYISVIYWICVFVHRFFFAAAWNIQQNQIFLYNNSVDYVCIPVWYLLTVLFISFYLIRYILRTYLIFVFLCPNFILRFLFPFINFLSLYLAFR